MKPLSLFLAALFFVPFSLFIVPYSAEAACISVPYGLSAGSRNTSVLQLQQFLLGRNYPGSGAWMLSGYFGSATRQALKNFQMESGLSQTGITDTDTIAAIQRVSCGGTPIVQTGVTSGGVTLTQGPTTTTASTCGTYYGYSPCPTTGVPGGPRIDYITPTNGATGSNVSIYGSGFSERGNSVHFGTAVIANLFSSDGKTMSFSVPQSLLGYGNQSISLQTYNVSALNANGLESNSMPFSVTSYGTGSNAGSLITSVSSPTSIAAGMQGVWTVTATVPSGSYLTATARWGDEVYSPTNPTTQSTFGNQQTFTFIHTYQTTGTYAVTFNINTNDGRTASTAAGVTVTGWNSSNSQVGITNVYPSQSTVGTVITIQGYGFTSSDNIIHFGQGGKKNVTSTNNGTTLQYVIPSYVSPCDLLGTSCGSPATQVSQGSYPLSVSNALGQSTNYTFYVTGY